MVTILDLSVELADGMVRYPSPYLPPVSVKPAATHEKEARSAQIVTFGTHVSTVPCDSGRQDDRSDTGRLPLRTRARAAVPRQNQGLTARRIRFRRHGRARPVLQAGARYGLGGIDVGRRQIFHRRPVPHPIASLDNLHLLAMDFPNIDSSADTVMGKPAPNHQILLGREVVLLENLYGLSAVDEMFLLLACPPKLVGGDGCPCRAVAIFSLSDAANWLSTGAKRD